MKREDLLAEMKKSVGSKDPIYFFEKMVDVFSMLFDRIDVLEEDLRQARIQSALAIQWEPRLASAMIAAQINKLRADKDTYFNEIRDLKAAFAEDRITQNYTDFCNYWVEILGFHPFLEYK